MNIRQHPPQKNLLDLIKTGRRIAMAIQASQGMQSLEFSDDAFTQPGSLDDIFNAINIHHLKYRCDYLANIYTLLVSNTDPNSLMESIENFWMTFRAKIKIEDLGTSNTTALFRTLLSQPGFSMLLNQEIRDFVIHLIEAYLTDFLILAVNDINSLAEYSDEGKYLLALILLTSGYDVPFNKDIKERLYQLIEHLSSQKESKLVILFDHYMDHFILQGACSRINQRLMDVFNRCSPKGAGNIVSELRKTNKISYLVDLMARTDEQEHKSDATQTTGYPSLFSASHLNPTPLTSIQGPSFRLK